MANRYTRTSASTFNPLSLQDLLMVPMYKQGLHDQVLGSAEELSSIKLNYLDKDAELVDEFKSGYNKELDELTTDILEKGVNGRSKSRLSSLSTKRKKWLEEGEGASAQANYARFADNKKDLEKMYQTGKISRDKYQAGIQQSLNQYKGVAAGDTYSPFNAVLDSDYDDKAREIARDISNNPHKITSLSGLKYDPRTGKYVDFKTKREYTEDGAIKQAVQAGLMMDPAIMADLRQREQLGLLGTTPEEFIGNLGSINEFIFRKNNVDRSRSFTGIDQGQIDDRALQSGAQFEFGPDKTFEKQQKDLNRHLSKMIQGDNVGGDGIPRYQRDAEGNYIKDPLSGNFIEVEGGSPATYSNMQPQQQREYDSLYDGLVRSGRISPDISKDSKAAAQSVKEYLDETSGVTYQDIKYTDGLIREYSGRGKKFRQSNSKDIAKGIALNGSDRLFIDVKKGKRVKFDDLSEEQKEQMLKGEAQVAAVYSPRNMLADELITAGEIDQRSFVSPHEVVFPDGSRFLVSRSESEMRQPSYQADAIMNRMYRDFTKYPEIPHNYNLPAIGKVEVTSNLDGSIKVIEEDGDITTFENSGEFEFFFDKALGIE